MSCRPPPDPAGRRPPKRPVSFVNLAGWSGGRQSFEVPARCRRSRYRQGAELVSPGVGRGSVGNVVGLPPVPETTSPQVASPRPSSKRPIYLVIALMLVWMVGLAGATQGCQTIDVLHRPEAVRAAMNHITDVQMARRQEALIETVLEFRTMVTPFAVGQLISGHSADAHRGAHPPRPRSSAAPRGASHLGLLAVPAYRLHHEAPHARVGDRRGRLGSRLSPLEGGVAPEIGDLREVLWWAARGVLGGQLAILIAGLVVMTRPRVRAFFGTIAGEQPGRLEP